MNNVQVMVVVEGQTEKTFLRDVLGPDMAKNGIYLKATLLGSTGKKGTGGDVRFERVVNDIKNHLKQRPDTYISTMLDFFRIDSNWPGKKELVQKQESGIALTANEKAKILEVRTLEEVQKRLHMYNLGNRFIPYIGMHEFEALLFSNAEVLAKVIEMKSSSVDSIMEKFDSPEDINDNPANAPSKQLERLVPGYRKVMMGKSIAEAIGIQRIREQCPHFNSWLVRLEALS